jgi:opacity protein-like surface antigen
LTGIGEAGDASSISTPGEHVPIRTLLALLLALSGTTAAAVTPYVGGGVAGSRMEAQGPINSGTASDQTLGVRGESWRQEVGFMNLASTSLDGRQYRMDGYRYLAGYDLMMGTHWGLTVQAGAWFHRSESAEGETTRSTTSAVAGAGLTFRPRRGFEIRVTANHYPGPAVGDTLETAGLQFLFNLP